MADIKMLIPGYPKLKRTGLKKAIIHNTAGRASAKQEAIRLKAKSQWENGNAHKFIDENDVVTVIDMQYVSYNCGNWDMNCNSISYEICKSLGDKKTFLKAEQNAFKEVAKDLKKYGKDTNIIDLHRNIIATACPHRSQEIHGAGKKCLDYFKGEVKKNMGTNAKPSKPREPGKGEPVGIGYFMFNDMKECRFNLYRSDRILAKMGNEDHYNYWVEVNSGKGRNIWHNSDGTKVNKWNGRRVALCYLDKSARTYAIKSKNYVEFK